MMDLLSYGALLQMYIYLKDSYYMNFYMQMLEKGIAAATNQDQMNQTDRAAQSSIN